jgi:hypothetical protein
LNDPLLFISLFFVVNRNLWSLFKNPLLQIHQFMKGKGWISWSAKAPKKEQGPLKWPRVDASPLRSQWDGDL